MTAIENHKLRRLGIVTSQAFDRLVLNALGEVDQTSDALLQQITVSVFPEQLVTSRLFQGQVV